MSVSYPPAGRLSTSKFVVNTNPDPVKVLPPTTYGPDLTLTGTAPSGGSSTPFNAGMNGGVQE